MAIIQNSAIIQKLVDELELSPSLEKIPTELADKILPTFQVNTQEIITKNSTVTVVLDANVTDADGLTEKKIYDVPATGKFFLTDIHLCLALIGGISDSWIEITIGGVAKKIGYIKGLDTATYDPDPTQITRMNFTYPILIDAGSDIILKRTVADRGLTSAEIYGFIELT